MTTVQQLQSGDQLTTREGIDLTRHNGNKITVISTERRGDSIFVRLSDDSHLTIYKPSQRVYIKESQS